MQTTYLLFSILLMLAACSTPIPTNHTGDTDPINGIDSTDHNGDADPINEIDSTELSFAIQTLIVYSTGWYSIEPTKGTDISLTMNYSVDPRSKETIARTFTHPTLNLTFVVSKYCAPQDSCIIELSSNDSVWNRCQVAENQSIDCTLNTPEEDTFSLVAIPIYRGTRSEFHTFRFIP